MEPFDAAVTTGWKCFPCLATTAPACPRGFHAATDEPATLMHLGRLHPAPLVGVATAPCSGVVCLDIDCGESKANAHLPEHGSMTTNTACPGPGGTRRNQAGSMCCSGTHQVSGAVPA